MGETLKLPSRFLHLRSNVCRPQKYKSQQMDRLRTPSSSFGCLNFGLFSLHFCKFEKFPRT